MKSAIDYLIIIKERQEKHNFDVSDVPEKALRMLWKQRFLIGYKKDSILTAEGFEILEKKF